MTGTVRHDRSLDFLKIIGTILIMLHHYQSAFGVHFGPVDFGNGRFYFGYVVELFFIISGYLAYGGADNIAEGMRFRDFYLKKLARLLPVAAISTVFAALFVLLAWKGAGFRVWPVILTCIGANAGGAVTALYINSHLWYISVLLICLALFYIVTRLCGKTGSDRIIAYAAVVLFGVCMLEQGWDLPFINWNSGRGYRAFFTGVLLAAALKDREIPDWAGIVCLLVDVAAVLLTVFRYSWVEEGYLYMLTFIFYPALIIAVKSKTAARLLDRRFIELAAAISFDVYIWHFEMNSFIAWANDRFSLGLGFASVKTELLVLGISTAIGTLSYFFIDRPLSAFFSKKIGRLSGEKA